MRKAITGVNGVFVWLGIGEVLFVLIIIQHTKVDLYANLLLEFQHIKNDIS